MLASMTKGEQDNKGPELNSSSDNEEDKVQVPDESPIVEDMSTPKEIVDIEVIEDWETRFRRANYSQEQIRIVKLGQQKMREWLELKGLQDWTQQANTDGVKIEYRTSARGFNTLKAQAVLPFNIMDIFVTLMDAKSRPLYDVNIDEASHTISRIAANTTAIYQKSKKIFVVSSRDFVLVSHLHRVSKSDTNLCLACER